MRQIMCCVTTILALVGPAISPANAAGPVSLVVELPEGLPGKIVFPLSCRVVAAPQKGVVLRFQHDLFGAGPVVAQCVSDGRSAWALAAIRNRNQKLRRVTVKAVVVDAAAGGPGVTFVSRTGGLECREGEKPILFYRREPHSLDGGKHVAANYIHPLYGLDQSVLTQDFPDDHKHHHGIFWTWHQLWVGTTRAGDPWINKDFLPVVREARVVERGPVFAELKTQVDWTSPLIVGRDKRPQPIVAEQATIRVFRAAAGARHIDFRVELKAVLKDVRIGGSENVKGYSGFTVRMRPPVGMVIHDAGGRLGGDRVQTASHWADISGRFGKSDAVTGLSILCHPTYPESPPRWLLRHYGMQNVAWPGRVAVPLRRAQAVVLRNRLVLHRGDFAQSKAAARQEGYRLLDRVNPGARGVVR
ncbi:MAG: DUF6807 family protein [Planctomycetaceae bacterium]